MSPKWRTPGSQSLEDFIRFILSTLMRLTLLVMLVAVAIYVVRCAVTADASQAPWEALPVVGRLLRGA